LFGCILALARALRILRYRSSSRSTCVIPYPLPTPIDDSPNVPRVHVRLPTRAAPTMHVDNQCMHAILTAFGTLFQYPCPARQGHAYVSCMGNGWSRSLLILCALPLFLERCPLPAATPNVLQLLFWLLAAVLVACGRGSSSIPHAIVNFMIILYTHIFCTK